MHVPVPAEMASAGPWKVLAASHVQYKEGSALSHALAIVTLSPYLVGSALGGAFVATRRVAWAWALLGAAVTTALSVALKALLQQPRPPGSHRPGPGMPSEHAAFAAFCATHLCLWLTRRCHPRQCRSRRADQAIKAAIGAPAAAWALLVAVSRLHLGVHSSGQVAAGLCLGFLVGCVWFLSEALCWVRHLAWLQDRVDSWWECYGLRSLDVISGFGKAA